MSLRSNLKLFAFAALSIALLVVPLCLQESSSQAIWPIIGVVDLFFMVWLLGQYKNSGPVVLVLIFMFTYYLAPLPYFLFRIPIVPYTADIGYAPFLKTWCIMSSFLGFMCLFSCLSSSRRTDRAIAVGDAHNISKRHFGALTYCYWIGVYMYMAATFKGQSVINNSGFDNYDSYMGNLKSQSGALEYFLILVVLGFEMSRGWLQRSCYFVAVGYYIYFSFTRGYRVQMLEMVLLLSGLHFGRYLTIKKCFAFSIVGFCLLQAHGMMKHGGGADLGSLFSVMAGDEMSSNQTEVFYTSNTVLNAVLNGEIPNTKRLVSLSIAILACVLPGGVLPDNWHSTVSAQSVTHLPVGGGGFIAGHYYYWLSYVGVALAGYLVVLLFRTYQCTANRGIFLLSILLLATCPRWVAYEPLAMFFRLGLYFFILHAAMNSFEEMVGMIRVPRAAL